MNDLSGALSGVKPGIKTTELLVAVVYGVANFLVMIHVIHTGIPARDSGALQAGCAISIGLVSVGYSVARGIAKKDVATPADYLAQLVNATKNGDADAIATAKAALPGLATAAHVSPSLLAKLEADVKLVKSHLGMAETLVEGAVPAAAPVITDLTNDLAAAEDTVQGALAAPPAAQPPATP